ncbi:MFS transporter [Lysobacter sp. K5869]|uniref:MFS transporter n=1 Tax=Lysobacter sp. K5869 TaxID=2820808 RepID=UPI001C062E42|nr:MFS transporter [Lysobacter sp. K5869]QWP74768.1 MFS transporter [Lysobacter sp. K5869]
MTSAPPAPAGHSRLLTGLLLALFLGALEQTIVATALPAIVRDLAGFDLLGWALSAYLLATAAATPVIGKLSDLHGRRALLRACMALFALGSTVCALAPDMRTLIAGRAIQGVGGAGLIVVAQAAVAQLAGPAQRSRYAGYFALVWAAAGLIGPLLGGALSDWLHWRAIFWINLPLGALVLWIGAPGLRALGRGDGAGRIDPAATALFATATSAFLLALSWGGARHPWTSMPVLSSLAVALIAGAAFFARQRGSADPLLAPAWLRDPAIGPALAASLLLYGFYIAVAVLMPAYWQLGHGLRPALSGALLVPALLTGAIGALLGGRSVARSGDYKRPVLPGLAVAALAFAAMGALATQLSAWMASALLALVAFGLGPCMATINAVAQNAAPARQLGALTGAMALSRTLGTAVVVAAASAMIVARVRHGGGALMGALGAEGAVARALPATTRALLRGAFAELFFAAAAGIALSLLCYAWIRPRDASPAELAESASGS